MWARYGCFVVLFQPLGRGFGREKIDLHAKHLKGPSVTETCCTTPSPGEAFINPLTSEWLQKKGENDGAFCEEHFSLKHKGGEYLGVQTEALSFPFIKSHLASPTSPPPPRLPRASEKQNKGTPLLTPPPQTEMTCSSRRDN